MREPAVGEFTGGPAYTSVKEGVQKILQGLQMWGLDPQDENFKDTPDRVARAYGEIFGGMWDTDRRVGEILKASFESSCKEMIVAEGVRVYSMCPHHLLPVEYDVAVAYIPDGRVLGISKLARIVEILAKRPVLQETLTEEIADVLFKDGFGGMKSLGSAVRVRGVHYCMKMRGARQQNSKVVTSAIRGAFEQPEVRAEFLALVNGGKL